MLRGSTGEEGTDRLTVHPHHDHDSHPHHHQQQQQQQRGSLGAVAGVASPGGSPDAAALMLQVRLHGQEGLVRTVREWLARAPGRLPSAQALLAAARQVQLLTRLRSGPHSAAGPAPPHAVRFRLAAQPSHALGPEQQQQQQQQVSVELGGLGANRHGNGLLQGSYMGLAAAVTGGQLMTQIGHLLLQLLDRAALEACAASGPGTQACVASGRVPEAPASGGASPRGAGGGRGEGGVEDTGDQLLQAGAQLGSATALSSWSLGALHVRGAAVGPPRAAPVSPASAAPDHAATSDASHQQEQQQQQQQQQFPLTHLGMLARPLINYLRAAGNVRYCLDLHLAHSLVSLLAAHPSLPLLQVRGLATGLVVVCGGGGAPAGAQPILRPWRREGTLLWGRASGLAGLREHSLPQGAPEGPDGTLEGAQRRFTGKVSGLAGWLKHSLPQGASHQPSMTATMPC